MTRTVVNDQSFLQTALFRLWFGLGPLLGPNAKKTLSHSLGWICWRLDRIGRRTVEANLKCLRPHSSVDWQHATSLRCYCNFIRHCLDMTQLADPEPKYKLSKIIGPFEAGTPLPSPSIIVTAHVNWETCLSVGNHLGILPESNALALQNDGNPLSQFLAQQRQAVGCTTLFSTGAPLAPLRALRRNERLIIVGDRTYGSAFLTYERHGVTWRLPAGPAALAAQTNTPIIPAILIISRHQPPALLIHPPLRPDQRLRAQDRVQHLGRQHARALLWLLNKAANQWVAFHPLFERHNTSPTRKHTETGGTAA